MADPAALKKLENQLNCPICLDTYTDPKQLLCQHVYCQQCLHRQVNRERQGQLRCPNCRQVTPVPANGVAGLPAAFHINPLLDILREHKKAKEGTLYCSAQHQERELELYCETCQQLICFQCTVTDHRSHNYYLVTDIFEKCKQEIETSLTQAKTKLPSVREASEHVQALKRVVLDRQATLEAKMYQDRQQLIELITARTNKHVSNLRHITDKRIRALDSCREQLETIEAQLRSGLDTVEETLRTGAPAKVVRMKTAIATQIKELSTSLTTDTLAPPAVCADMDYSTGSNVWEACRSYGVVGDLNSPVPSLCRATGMGLESADVGKKSSVVLQIVNFKGQPCEMPIQSSECELGSEITGARVRGDTKRVGQGKYKISYHPNVKGRHQLHIKVEGQHIRGSPFSVAVKSAVELGLPMLTMQRVKQPFGVAINQRREVVVSEWDGHRVSVFRPSGLKLRSFGLGHFNHPAGVAVHEDGTILVADCDNHHIVKLTIDGEFLGAVGTNGSDPLQFLSPRSVAVNKINNRVYVADTENARVQVLNSDLTYVSSFGKKGAAKGQFNRPFGIACDRSGNVYVVDRNNHRIQVFTPEGGFLRLFGRQGTERGEINTPRGIAIDTNDMVYVTDGNNRVSIFTPDGLFVTSFGGTGALEGEFNRPLGVTVDSEGVVYVCDYDNHRVQLF